MDKFFSEHRHRVIDKPVASYRLRIMAVQPKNACMNLVRKTRKPSCPTDFQTRNFVKASKMREPDKRMNIVDFCFPCPLFEGKTTCIERPWNGCEGSPEGCLVRRTDSSGVVFFVFVPSGKDCFDENQNPLTSSNQFWMENLEIFKRRNPFGGKAGKNLAFSPIAFFMTGMRFHYLDREDIVKPIEEKITSFYQTNPGDFATVDGRPRYLDIVNKSLISLGKQALELAKPFLPENFEESACTTKFNHDLGMVFDPDLTLNYVISDGWKYPKRFFSKTI